MSKIIKFSIAVLVAGTVVASAAQISIDKQIQQIQHAPVSQRFKLMNQFKIRLHNMNQRERLQAINTLQKQMHASSSNTMKNNNNMDQYPNNINHMQQTTQMMRTNMQQNRYQQQAIKQFNQQPNSSPRQQTTQPIRIPMH